LAITDNKAQIFDLLNSITSATSRKSLEVSLVATLIDFLSELSPCITLLRTPRKLDCDYLEVAHFAPTLNERGHLTLIPNPRGELRIEKDSCFNQCIQDGHISHHQEANSKRVLFPIVTNKLVTGVLDIDSDGLSNDIVGTISGFLSIYSNFMAMAYENEHDTLTGLRNRKTFDYHLSELLSSDLDSKGNNALNIEERRTQHKEEHHWISVLDIDFFKKVNDNFGHVYGDEVLILFSEIMVKTFRSSDMLFRYGGEEFVVVLAPTNAADALAVFERFRVAVEDYSFPKVGKITVSIGCASIQFNEHPTTTLEFADEALYYAKAHGRNQVCDYYNLFNEGNVIERAMGDEAEIF